MIAWASLKLPETLRDAGPDDETLAALKLLAGHDEDLAHESTRHINRLRRLLLQQCRQIPWRQLPLRYCRW